MLTVYIGGPFRAGTNYYQQEKNIREAEAAGYDIAANGMAPLIPHTMYRFFQGGLPDDFWIEATLTLLKKCHALYLLPKWQDSQGAIGERKEADRLGIPIFENLAKLYSWKADREFGEYLATSSGAFISDMVLSLAHDLAAFGPDACEQLVKYMESGIPACIDRENALSIAAFLNTISRHEFDVLAARLLEECEERLLCGSS